MNAPKPIALANGDTIADFLVGDVLGVGGMGHVYAATDQKLHRQVALKVLRAPDDDERARFLREAEALARIDDERVVRVFAFGDDEDRGLLWMALELIEGQTLADVVEVEGVLDEEAALSVCAEIARGAAAMHAASVVHRDLKPENVMLDEDGMCRIVDFGVALVRDDRGGYRTQAGVTVGTPHFMSPEQARGERVDERTDTWGIGATLATLLTGRPPFYSHGDEADLDILARVLRDPYVPPNNISGPVRDLLARMLEKDRAKRPSDVLALADELEHLATAAEADGQVPQTIQSSRGIFPIIALGVLGISGLGFLMSLAMGREEPVEPPPVVREVPREAAGEVAPAVEVEPTPDLAPEVAVEPTLEEVFARGDDEEMIERLSTEGPALLTLFDDKSARAHVGVLEVALMEGRGDVALDSVRLLQAARNVRALEVLQKAARAHVEPAVRRAAKRASSTILQVE